MNGSSYFDYDDHSLAPVSTSQIRIYADLILLKLIRVLKTPRDDIKAQILKIQAEDSRIK